MLFTFLSANLSAYLDPYKSLIFRTLRSQSKLKALFRIGLGLFYCLNLKRSKNILIVLYPLKHMVFIFNLKLEFTATNRAHCQIKMDKRARYFLIALIFSFPITLSFFIVVVLFMSKFLCIIEKIPIIL